MRWTCRAAVGVAFAALAACKSSSPSPPSCSAGQTVCAPAGGGQAICSDLASDTKNCGRCGNACPVPDGGATSCASGACAPTCASSRQTVCTSAGQDGGSAAPFCTDTEADFGNCGSCGVGCGGTEVCQGASCRACPIAQCGNQCVDTQRDPANCGACGTSAGANMCEGGQVTGFSGNIKIELPSGFQGVAGAATITIPIKVHSLLRVQGVTANANNSGVAPCTLVTAPETSPTSWSCTVTVPGAPLFVVFIATDEQFIASQNGPASHRESASLNVPLVVPTIVFSSISVTLASADVSTKWVPLNAPKLTLQATVSGAPSGVTQIAFRNRGTVIALQPVGQPSVQLAPADVGLGAASVDACGVDPTGAVLTSQCASPPRTFTVGTIPVGAAKPILARSILSGDTSHTIFFIPPNSTNLFGQNYATPNANVAMPGQVLGANAYAPASLTAAPDGGGVYAIRSTGAAVERFDACNTNLGCQNANFILAGGVTFTKIQEVSPVAMLLLDGTGAGYYAQARPNQTSDTAVAASGPTPGTAGKLMTLAGSIPAAVQTKSGALVGMFNFADTTLRVILYHPNITGAQHQVILATQPLGALATAVALYAFPNGEIAFQFNDTSGNRYVGAAFYDGTATPPVVLSPTAAPSPFAPTNPVAPGALANLIVARQGVMVGTLTPPGQTDGPTVQQVVELNVAPGTTPKLFVPVVFGTNGVGTAAGDVLDRVGSFGFFDVSDDGSKALFMTDDIVNRTEVFSLRMLDLGTGTATLLVSSEMLIVNTVFPLSSPHFVHDANANFGRALANPRNAAVWTEQLAPSPSTTLFHARISYATWSGSGAPGIASVDRLAAFAFNHFPTVGSIVDSAAGNAIFFLSDNDAGGADLYTVPLNPAAGVVTATKIVDRAYWFRIREDKGRLLVARSDGSLLYAPLAGTGTLAQRLAPILDDVILSDTSWTRNLNSFGFTPDGDHAYAATGQTFVGQFTYWTGNLQVIDLGSPTFARTNFGRVSWGAAMYLASTSIDVSLNRFPAHVFSGGTSAVIGDTGSANQFRQRLFFSAQPNPTVHKDTLAVPFSSAVSAATNTFISESSLDASEAYVCPPAPTGATAGTFSAVFQKDVGLVQPLPAPIATTADPHGNPQQAAVYQPGVLAVDIGQPFTPEYSQINSGNGSFFKVWGEGGGRPVVTLSKFTTATPQLPYTRQTPDNTELLYSFTDTQADGNYVIALPLAGKAPLPPLLP